MLLTTLGRTMDVLQFFYTWMCLNPIDTMSIITFPNLDRSLLALDFAEVWEMPLDRHHTKYYYILYWGCIRLISITLVFLYMFWIPIIVGVGFSISFLFFIPKSLCECFLGMVEEIQLLLTFLNIPGYFAYLIIVYMILKIRKLFVYYLGIRLNTLTLNVKPFFVRSPSLWNFKEIIMYVNKTTDFIFFYESLHVLSFFVQLYTTHRLANTLGYSNASLLYALLTYQSFFCLKYLFKELCMPYTTLKPNIPIFSFLVTNFALIYVYIQILGDYDCFFVFNLMYEFFFRQCFSFIILYFFITTLTFGIDWFLVFYICILLIITVYFQFLVFTIV